MGNCVCSGTEQNFGGNENLVYAKKITIQEYVLHGNKSYVVNISLTKIQIVQ